MIFGYDISRAQGKNLVRSNLGLDIKNFKLCLSRTSNNFLQSSKCQNLQSTLSTDKTIIISALYLMTICIRCPYIKQENISVQFNFSAHNTQKARPYLTREVCIKYNIKKQLITYQHLNRSLYSFKSHFDLLSKLCPKEQRGLQNLRTIYSNPLARVV